MHVRLLAALAVASTLLAGCLQTATVAPAADDGGVADLLLRPWLDNWHARTMNVSLDYDPEARHAEAVAVLSIVNDLGTDRPWVWIGLEALDVASLKDETGADLEFTIEKGLGGRLSVLPPEVQDLVAAFQVVNVTLAGDVAHGASHTLTMEYGGWRDEDSPLFLPVGTDVPVGLPNEVAENLHFGLVPILAATPTEEIRLTMRSPSSWTSLASGGVVSWEDDGTTTTVEYAVKSVYVAITSLKGLEWIDENVGGVWVRTHFFPDMRTQGRTMHDITKRVLEDMPKWTGPYPYDHLFTVPSGVVANAFSTPGLTFMGLNFYRFTIPNAPYQFGRFTPYAGGKDGFEMVIVHEHIHNWWGHNVEGNSTDDANGANDHWITEGVTTYLSETVWFKDQYGEGDAAASSNAKGVDMLQNRVLNGGAEYGAAQNDGDYYEKTAVALRGLEAYAIAKGKPFATFEALKSIQGQYGLVQGGRSAVDSAEAWAAFEDALGEDLDWLWDSYFLGSDLADITVKSVKSEGANVTIEVASGTLPAGAMVRAVTLSGRELFGIGAVPAGETATISIAKPAGAAMEPIVRVEVDPLQYVYESDETNNVWIGNA